MYRSSSISSRFPWQLRTSRTNFGDHQEPTLHLHRFLDSWRYGRDPSTSSRSGPRCGAFQIVQRTLYRISTPEPLEEKAAPELCDHRRNCKWCNNVQSADFIHCWNWRRWCLQPATDSWNAWSDSEELLLWQDENEEAQFGIFPIDYCCFFWSCPKQSFIMPGHN